MPALLQNSALIGTGSWTVGVAQTNQGSRKYRLWVPAGNNNNTASAMVMMLHGCTQTAEDFAALSEFNRIADREGFLVLYPEQSRRANFLKCWNWFDPAHQSRDSGEPHILASMVTTVKSLYRIDPDRIYVAGVSAGGAMAVIMGATYPDLFSAIGVCAGVPYKAATSRSAAWSVMKHGGTDPDQNGLFAFQAMGAGLKQKSRSRMPLIVFHGVNDHRVPLVNADHLIAQWIRTNERLAGSTTLLSEEVVQGSVAGGHNYARHIYKENGNLLMEKWIVEGLGHAWSGSHAHSRYADPRGPSASEEIWRFFRETTSRGKTQ